MKRENVLDVVKNIQKQNQFNMKKKLGQESAFPVTYTNFKSGQPTVKVVYGMSTRLYLAGMAMQGILSTNINLVYRSPDIDIWKHAAQMSLRYADSLLKEENNTQETIDDD